MACEKYKSYQKPENLKHKLHFTGSSTVSYDGSKDVTVNIPSNDYATTIQSLVNRLNSLESWKSQVLAGNTDVMIDVN